MKANRNTKIVATLGPASTQPGDIARLAEAGVNVFRFNMSHGSHAEHQERYLAVRQAEAQLGRPLGVMLDLQGPKIRVGKIPGGPRLLKAGDLVQFSAASEEGDGCIPFPHPEVLRELEPGHVLLLDDGKLRLEVTQTGEDRIALIVRIGGTLSDRKGVNLPTTSLSMSVLTPKDRIDLAFGLGLGVDWVALSFVQCAADVLELRELVGLRVGIIAKIEKPSAISDLQAIARASDALMVARGDLGVELPAESVPGLQRRIIEVARRLGRPVVVATQMLESMIQSASPTRAEVSDVATAVYQGADAVMLSAETAAGSYPLESVAMMARVIAQAEADLRATPTLSPVIESEASRAIPIVMGRADVIGAALSAVCASQRLASAVTYTASGASALCVARVRPATALLALTPHASTARRLCLVWGVRPMLAPDARSVEDMVGRAVACVRSLAIGSGERDGPIAVVAGLPFATPGSTNLMQLVWPDQHVETGLCPANRPEAAEQLG
jgi:pyruvate kinase